MHMSRKHPAHVQHIRTVSTISANASLTMRFAGRHSVPLQTYKAPQDTSHAKTLVMVALRLRPVG